MSNLSSPCVLAAALTIASTAFAVPAPPFALSLANADGSRVQGRLFGDEHLAWFEDLDGFSIAYDEESGSWRYAVLAPDGALQPGAHRVGDADPQHLGLTAHLRPGPALVRRALNARKFAPAALPAPPRGTVPNLVLLVKFRNQTSHFTPADFEPIFNGETGSVREYYREVSNGQLDLVSTLVGWIELPNDDSYYAYNDRNPFGVPWHMVRDAVRILDAQGFDFTRFDADQDGRIDAIDIIHSGPAYETTGNRNYIHSHFAPLMWNALRTHDGITIWAYHTEAEFGPDNRSPTQLGVIAHETAHFFGLPDLYDYDYDSAGLGLWCLMSSGAWAGDYSDGSRPTHLSAWAKAKLGFVVPESIETRTEAKRLAPTEESASAVVIKGGLPGEQYFILENRRRVGYDRYLPGEGLLIFHVDEERSSNDDQDHYLVDLEQADGRRDLNRHPYGRGDASDPFPLANNDAFTPLSTPSSLPYGAVSGSVFVTAIRRDGPDIVFDVEVRPPAPLGAPCEAGAVCQSGTCAEGVCCDRSCDGPCSACSVAGGAPTDGTCVLVSGRSCDDLNPCTIDDACVEGVCRGGAPKPCEPISSCHEAGECIRETGRCTAPRRPEGAPCDDGNACTDGETCSLGYCQPGTPIQCVAADECHLAGTCDPATGQCSTPPAPDGTACAQGSCASGTCTADAVGGKCGCSSGPGTSPLFSLLAGLALLVQRRRLRARGRAESRSRR